jgi:hypothetical protein
LFFIEHQTRRLRLAGVTANPTVRGSPSRPATCCWCSANKGAGCGSCSAIGTRSSLAASTTCSARQVARCCRHRPGHPRRTRTRSAGSGRCAPSAWTGCSFLGGPALSRSFRYAEHDNAHRPRRALRLKPPFQQAGLTVGEYQPARVHRRDLLDGLIHGYRRAARTPLRTLHAGQRYGPGFSAPTGSPITGDQPALRSSAQMPPTGNLAAAMPT